MTDRLEIRRPDDWHVHFRDGAVMKAVLPATARQFARAIVMPNLVPPVVTTDDAEAYRARLMDCLPDDLDFTPLMTAYLTDGTDPDNIAAGHETGILTAVKLYPAHATTNSAHGVTDLTRVEPVLRQMAEIGMPLLVHGEVTDPDIDIFDREAVFIERVLKPLLERIPDLRVVLEHITTAESANFVRSAGDNLAATITPHHMLINRSDLFRGGIRPHLYCLPIAKREQHRLAVREAAVSGHPRFFLGTDTAPHAVKDKESECGCAGIFNAPTALELYLEAFEEDAALEHFERFASLNGPAFYRLPPNETRVRLTREPTETPGPLDLPDGNTVLPFRSGQMLRWSVDVVG